MQSVSYACGTDIFVKVIFCKMPAAGKTKRRQVYLDLVIALFTD